MYKKYSLPILFLSLLFVCVVYFLNSDDSAQAIEVEKVKIELVKTYEQKGKLIGSFYMKNIGGIPIYVPVTDFDDGTIYCSQPEYFIRDSKSEDWKQVDLSYAGAIYMAEIEPGEVVLFDAPLNILLLEEDVRNKDIQIGVGLYRSSPFQIHIDE